MLKRSIKRFYLIQVERVCVEPVWANVESTTSDRKSANKDFLIII